MSATAAIAREHRRAIGRSDSVLLDGDVEVQSKEGRSGKPKFTRSNSFIGMQKGARRHAPYGKRADGVWGGEKGGSRGGGGDRGGRWRGRGSSSG